MMLLPELSIFCFSVVFLFLSLGEKKSGAINTAKFLSIIVFAVSLFSIFKQGVLFEGAYQIDLFSQFFKIIISCGLCIILLMLDSNKEIEDQYLPECIMFLGFSTLGLMMLTSAIELISIVIALEISSYSLYVIVPLRKGQAKIHLEASVKYLFFGAISTGIMLYGMSYVYGMTGSTRLTEIMLVLPKFLQEPMGVFALVLTLTGFFFKLSLFPMHFWSPDIYEGASNTTTTFIGTIPKIAATAVIIRLTILAASGVNSSFVNFLMILAAVSMTFGNLVGLVQKDLKRLLAYSGIAHAGYLLLGILALSEEGSSAAMFYITIYLFMNLAAFYAVILVSKRGENVTVDDLVGLSRRAPLLAVTLAVSAFSLAGVPPTGGFTGKLFLFTAAFKEGHLAIVIIGAVNTAISIFYYLNLVRMSFSKDSESVETMPLAFHEKTVCYVLILLILYLGIYPYGLLNLLRAAVA
ncbi:MAG TPA: NADH-quinone oxidoreductase subunit N [Syntrophorhabdaceae bacterium]|nr:NADH-quinone oxidoreductase subunit N [Syntrophorhabdaceae bacterium]